MKKTKRNVLREFFGVLSKDTGAKLERAIRNSRKRHKKLHRARMDYIIKSFNKD